MVAANLTNGADEVGAVIVGKMGEKFFNVAHATSL